jgi:hypothetical protein
MVLEAVVILQNQELAELAPSVHDMRLHSYLNLRQDRQSFFLTCMLEVLRIFAFCGWQVLVDVILHLGDLAETSRFIIR